jgi:DNA mismatch repair protein MutS
VEISREGKIPSDKLPWKNPPAEVAAEFAFGLSIRKEAEALCSAELHLDDAEGGGFRITGTKRRIQAALTVLRDGGDTSATVVTYKNTASLETATLEDISRRHRTWWAKWVSMWSDEWASTCAALAERSSTHQHIEMWSAEIDLSWTVHGLAAEWLWKHPEFVSGADESFVDVVRLRHPILERIQTQVPYVPHTLCMDSGNTGLLLYGMNASGKSSLMKALGMCVLLAQCGFPVPVESCRICPFSSVFTRILGNDNLWSGLSSFAVEMTEFREILHHADKNSLVLGDELCSGTESLSATALVAAGIETLAQRKSKFVFATHLHELATIVDVQGVRAVHLKVHYDAGLDRLIYDRNLADGPGSSLYGLEVCRALDLPSGYLDRATTIRSRLSGTSTPKQSSYSVAAVMDCCAVCSSHVGLEMHHIFPQKDAAAAEAVGMNIHSGGNLVCLCAVCHDHHHGGRLLIEGWQDTSEGRKLKMTWVSTKLSLPDNVRIWIREQKQRKVRAATIRRLAGQTFNIEVSLQQIKEV